MDRKMAKKEEMAKEPNRIKVYVSGKISGLDIEVARERFAKAAVDCLELFPDYDSVEVVDPMALPTLSDMDWADYMLLDLQLLRHCDAIVMMPGWEESSGAVIENTFSARMGKEIRYLKE